MTPPITFVVPGQTEQSDSSGTRGGGEPIVRLPAGFERGRIKGSVQLRATRGSGPNVELTANPGSDVVVMEIAGGPSLVLHPETARELLLAQDRPSAAREGTGDGAGGIAVPLRLEWSGIDEVGTRATRGSFGGVLVSAFHVVTDVFKGKAADFVADKIVDKVDAQVTEGVYKLDPTSLPVLKDTAKPVAKITDGPADRPALVLIHGTFSSTQGTFQKLWANHAKQVGKLFKFYSDRVYALDHATLGRSPIENALTLANAMPRGTRLHLVTHSRGGLVAEVLAKVCKSQTLSNDDRKLFTAAGWTAQLRALDKLCGVVKAQGIRVDRVVRVACPVRGTLLASKRLDAYVSVLKWSLELANVPVAPAIVDFLGMVAQRREQPDTMPGLAAQIPNSPLVQWLHGGGDDIDGDLRVIAGDLEGDSVTSWLKTLLSDAFYWTDNDLVVQTRGMYGGPPRAGGATFLLDQGGKVSHFNYFFNERSADAVVSALTEGSPPEGFREIGPMSWAGKSATGTRGALPNAESEQTAGSDLPALILIPDAFGTHLRVGRERVWLSRRTATQFGQLTYGKKAKVDTDGLLESAYSDLSGYLAKKHAVIPFAYDWRLPIEKEAVRLASLIESAIDARGDRAASGPPVRIIGHGMGGLLARALEIHHRKTWKRLLGHEDARVLLLGVPNGGSWTPMQVLSGDEALGGILQGVGLPFDEQATRGIIGGFPGFMQLQAGLTDPALGLDKVKTWTELAAADRDRVSQGSTWHSAKEQIDVFSWGLPTADALAAAVAFRKQLDSQSETGFGEYADKVHAIAGTSRSTPVGFENENGSFLYRNVVDGGDGYITTENALLPGVRSWSVRGEHRSLTTNPDLFESYHQLLTTGKADVFTRVSTGDARGAPTSETFERTRPSRRRTSPPPAALNDLLSADVRDATARSGVAGPALAITVKNGNLEFIRQPLMLGHYTSMALTGTEWVMDRLIGGTMDQLVWLRQYPDLPGSHKVFLNRAVNQDNPLQMPRPEAVIVVGLGEEGKLTANDLTATVTHGVIAWAQQLVERALGPAAQFELAATLIGSGGAGVSAGQSAVAVAQGVREANLRLIEAGWPSVGHLHLIELYLDRAAEALRQLQIQSAAQPGQFRVAEIVQSGPGALRRPPESSYRGANYDFVTAMTQRDARGDSAISFRLDTKRARTEVHTSPMQVPLLRELVVSAANDRSSDTQIGRTLFQLLIPPEMEPFMGGTASMVLELDAGSAGIPWELLDSSAGTRGGGDKRPWAIRCKLLRKLRTDEYRPQVVDANAEAHVLVIGEPACDPTRYPRLPAAQAEASAVATQFMERSTLRARTDKVLPRDRVRAIISSDLGGADARTILNAVHEREWRIVHIAGHGEPPLKIGKPPAKPDDPPQRDGDPRGVVLSNGTFLGPREIDKMRVVPELVFVNCCHLAGRNAAQLLQAGDTVSYDRASFAAGVAESLIRIGVKCVIAAGWAVQDEAAKRFAVTFYDHLLKGKRFIDAVAEARAQAQSLGGNTWAAYQCYGDPDWKFRWGTSDSQEPDEQDNTPDLDAEFATVTSADALLLALETIAVRSQYDKRKPNDYRERIEYLRRHFASRWGTRGDVAEAFARALKESGDRAGAISWYEKAVTATDGSASLSAAEQLGNLRARLAFAELKTAQARLEKLAPKRARSGKRTDVAKARVAIQAARAELEALAASGATGERLSLCGSAWKRQAMIERLAGDAEAEELAITQVRDWYTKAERAAKERNEPNPFYPALNRMAAELLTDARKKTWSGFDPKALKEVESNLDQQTRDDPDFWSVVGQTELRVYKALAQRRLADELTPIQKGFDDLRARVSAPTYWDSVHLQLEFVLPKYAERATAAEKAAASALLKHVRQFTE